MYLRRNTLGDPAAAGFAYQTASGVWLWLGQADEAARASAAAIERFRESGNARSEAEALLTSAEAAIETGDLSRAEECVSHAADLVPHLKSAHLTAVWKRTKARIEIELGYHGDAHRLLIQALHGSRRSGDPELEVIALHDLAILTESTSGPKRASQWWSKALARARQSGLAARELDIARGASVNAVETGRLDEAIGILEHVTERHSTSRPTPVYERARADMGALLLTRATRQLSQSGQSNAGPSFEKGDEALQASLAEFITLGDIEWAGRAARNLKLSWRLQGKQCEGTDWLRSAGLAKPDRPAADGVLTEAAMLGIGCPEHAEWCVSWLRSRLTQSTDDALVMELARESRTLDSGDLLQDTDSSLALIRLACDIAEADNYWAYGDLVNALGVSLARADQQDDAEAAFSRAMAVADREDNRALMSLALANSAEIRAHRSEDEVARQLFAQSAELAEAVGDLDRAIASWSGTVQIDIHDNQPRAAETTKRMADLASTGASPEARAVALSAAATMAYLRGAYVKAFTLWRRAASLADEGRGRYLAFALDSLARHKDRGRFEQELEQIVPSLGRDAATIDFCTQVLRAASTWASDGELDAAGLTIATSMALASATLTSTQPATDAHSLFVRSLAVLHAAELVIDDLGDAGPAVAESVERHTRELIGDEPAEALQWILKWASEDSDTDDDLGG